MMYDYSLTQWILFFFWYCFLGWIWECFFVSVKRAWKKKKWQFVNRGFLHGPWIPIYGSAAIVILMATLSLRENTMAVYVIGACTATVFELVTGTVMERLFKVKYWDYSDLPLNYHGHICLFVSLFWGCFAVLLVQVVHVPVERVLLKLPAFPSEIAAFLLMILFVHDTTESFNEAMDLREILESLSEHNEAVKRLERRFDAVIAFAPIPDVEELRDLKLNMKESILHKVERLRSRNEARLDRIREYIQLRGIEELPDRQELLEKLEMYRKRLLEKSNKQFWHARNQLKRNPEVRSEKYQEALEQLKELLKNRDDNE